MEYWERRKSPLSGAIWREFEEPGSWLLAILAMTIAVGRDDIFSPSFYTSGFFIGLLIGFLAHETAHRQVARLYGLSATFVAYGPGLLLTLASSLLPVIILAPGYVRTISYGYGFSERGVLRSVAAGPATNIVIALAGLLLAAVSTNKGFFYGIATINLWLAFFNLLPFPPLDGEKIFRLDRKTWVFMILTVLALYAARSFI
ncbi:MAG: M50 family metallopeptidase [Desulfurococcales archaeon]|nr:M50 family metallopeptidase [Desulfurococcales archaeon]